MKAVIFILMMVFLWASLETAYSLGFKHGRAKGKAEAQTPAYIVETCSAWWWGSNKEATKMLKKYCEMKK